MMMSTIPPASIRSEKNSFHGRTSVRKSEKVNKMQVLTALAEERRLVRGATLPVCLGSDNRWYVYKGDHQLKARVSNELIAGGHGRIVNLGTTVTGYMLGYLVVDSLSVSFDSFIDETGPKVLVPPAQEPKTGNPVLVWFADENVNVDGIMLGQDFILDFRPAEDIRDLNRKEYGPQYRRKSVSKDLVVLEPGFTIVASRVLKPKTLYDELCTGSWARRAEVDVSRWHYGSEPSVDGTSVEKHVIWL